MSEEIQRLQLLERCRKRAADEPTHSLRRIFDTETQSSGSAAAAAVTSFAFADIESSMYKRRRLQLPILPTDANDVAARITGTRFEMCAGQQFFRGTITLVMEAQPVYLRQLHNLIFCRAVPQYTLMPHIRQSHISFISYLRFLLPGSNICFPSVLFWWRAKLKTLRFKHQLNNLCELHCTCIFRTCVVQYLRFQRPPPHCCYTALTWQLLVLGVSRNYHATLLTHCNPDREASDISIAPDALRRAICATDRSITANEKHRGGGSMTIKGRLHARCSPLI